MTARPPVRFPFSILMIGTAHALLAGYLAGVTTATVEGSFPFASEVYFALGILVWALSVLLWHGLALVGWRYRPEIVLAVALPSLLIALGVGSLNGSLVQLACTQSGLILSAVVTGIVTRRMTNRARPWLIGATISVAATLMWLALDYDKVMAQVFPPVPKAVATESSAQSETATTDKVQPSLTEVVTGVASDTLSTSQRTVTDSSAVSGITFGIDVEKLLARLLPSSLVISELAPVAVGGVLFARSVNALQGGMGLLPTLRVPFAVMPVLTVAIVMRLWLAEPSVQVADNLLFFLALVYLLGGIAIASFLMQHFSFPLPLRLGAWLLALLFAPYVFPLFVVGGLVDSFLDFRARMVIPPVPLS